MGLLSSLNNISKIYKGTNEIKLVYHNNKIIYENAAVTYLYDSNYYALNGVGGANTALMLINRTSGWNASGKFRANSVQMKSLELTINSCQNANDINNFDFARIYIGGNDNLDNGSLIVDNSYNILNLLIEDINTFPLNITSREKPLYSQWIENTPTKDIYMVLFLSVETNNGWMKFNPASTSNIRINMEIVAQTL